MDGLPSFTFHLMQLFSQGVVMAAMRLYKYTPLADAKRARLKM